MVKILKYWPKEEIVKALQSLPKDKPINKKTIIKYAKKRLICNPSLISKKFGSIKNACRKANIRCDALYGKEKIKYLKNINTKYTKKNIIALLQTAYKKYGIMIPTNFILKINKDNNIDIRVSIIKFFGKIKYAFEEANIPYKNYYWTNNRIINILEKLNKDFGPLFKTEINKFRRKKLICGSKLIRDRFGSIENAAKIAGFNFIEPQEKNHLFNGKIGKKETKFLNNLENIKNIKLYRQYKVNINDNIYFIDGYDKKNNVAYEFDEKLHQYHILDDKIRDNNIFNALGCDIVRIKNY